MLQVHVDGSFATVGAREDIDGLTPQVVVCPDRQEQQVELLMDPKTAKALARRINRWARLVGS